MKNRATLSLTAQRGYLYLALIIVIVVILLVWPAPKEEPIPPTETETATYNDSTNIQRHNKSNYNRSYNPRSNNYKHSPSYSKNDFYPRRYENNDTARLDTPRYLPKRKPLKVDINTADTLTLQLLHGIGPAYASRIVKYRNRLGGFVAKEQLLEVYGFSPELYEHIAPYLTISNDSIHRIRINEIGLKQLLKHPYIDYYQARDVISYRNKGHRYTSCNDLRLVVSMDDSTIARLKPYLDFE